MPRPLAGCSETLKRFNEALQRFRIYALSYKALQRFTEALSNLTRPRSLEHVRGIAQVNHSSPEQSNIHELITSLSLPSQCVFVVDALLAVVNVRGLTDNSPPRANCLQVTQCTYHSDIT